MILCETWDVLVLLNRFIDLAQHQPTSSIDIKCVIYSRAIDR